MFLEILQTLIRVLMVFSILIIAFGLAFYIVLSKTKVHKYPNCTEKRECVFFSCNILLLLLEQFKTPHMSSSHLAFTSIPMSLVRTFSMMLGEVDFVGTYVEPYWYNELPLPISSFLLLCKTRSNYFNYDYLVLICCVVLCRLGLFMILMPILLMNLLIGLAVGDIESVRRNAQLKRLAMQVVLHTELERKLPQMWLVKADKSELIEYPNSQKCKLGIFDIVLRKWFCNPFNDESMSISIFGYCMREDFF